MPTTEFNFNVKENKRNHPVIFLMKKDPELPFGKFSLQILFRDLADNEHYYASNELCFDEESQPHVLDITVPLSEKDEITRIQATQDIEDKEQ